MIRRRCFLLKPLSRPATARLAASLLLRRPPPAVADRDEFGHPRRSLRLQQGQRVTFGSGRRRGDRGERDTVTLPGAVFDPLRTGDDSGPAPIGVGFAHERTLGRARPARRHPIRVREPAGAASSHDVERFLALLTGLLMNRSAHGTRKVPPAELRAIATTAVRMFLAAYGTGADRPESALRPR